MDLTIWRCYICDFSIFGFLYVNIYLFIFLNATRCKKTAKEGEFMDGDSISSELFAMSGQIAQQGSSSHK